MLLVLLMGFSSGLPLALTASTLQAWMKKSGVDISVIGIFSVVGLPYAYKFLWAPFMDHYVPPVFGRRRGWALMTQVGLILATLALSYCDPGQSAVLLGVAATAIAFFSASQDIVVDAYRTEILRAGEVAAGSSLYLMGYRLGMLVSGALALMLADQIPWPEVIRWIALGMGIGAITILCAPEPETTVTTKSIREAFVEPLKEFFQRPGILEVFAFILLYKIDVAFASALLTPFFLDLGFAQTEIGIVFKVFGLFATIGGTLLGGMIMTKIGLRRGLWLFGILQAVSGASFIVLAHFPIHSMLVVSVTLENAMSGMGNAAFAAFLLSLCNKKFSGTQYAALTCLMALSRIMVQTPSGYLAKYLGWSDYFLVSILISIPALLLLTRYKVWMREKVDIV